MAATFKSTAKQVIRSIAQKEAAIVPAIITGMSQGMLEFRGHIQRTQMTGRPGLNVKTGTLRRSWYVKTRRKSARRVTVALGTRVKYARIHQTGGTIRQQNRRYLHFKGSRGWVKVQAVVIPKRLHIPESFEGIGFKMMRRRVVHSVRRVLKG